MVINILKNRAYSLPGVQGIHETLLNLSRCNTLILFMLSDPQLPNLQNVDNQICSRAVRIN